VTSSRDITIKICCLRYVGKSKCITIKAKNWLSVIICLQIHTEKMLRVPSKNAIVTSLPVTQGTPFF